MSVASKPQQGQKAAWRLHVMGIHRLILKPLTFSIRVRTRHCDRVPSALTSQS